MNANNNEFSPLILQIVDKILIKNNIEDTKQLFLIIMDSLQRFPYLYKLFDDNFIKKLIDIVPVIDGVEERSRVINAVLDVVYTFEYICDEATLNHLFELYLDGISEGYHDLAKIKETMFLLNDLGISYDCIFEAVINKCTREFCIDLFIGIHCDFKDEIIKKYPDVIDYMKQIERFQIRFFKILHFYFMADFLWAENLDIIRNYLKPFTNYWGICADWLFFSQGHRYKYVSDNILSEKEEQIFMMIGDIYHNCQKECNCSVDNEEELFDFLENVSEIFRQTLRSDEVQTLLEEFKNNRDFIDIIMNLPNGSQ